MRTRLANLVAAGLLVAPAFASRLAVRAPATPTSRTLSFADRVRAEEAIERVYYRHQIGATKPFEEAVPHALIEDKVRRYLEESAALDTLWKTPITDAALQRELERMAGGTRLPDRLKEVFDALGNDAFLIKECVARATLADRLAHNFYAYDPRYHAAARAEINALHDQITSGALSPTADNPHRTVGEIAVEPTSGAGPSSQIPVGPTRATAPSVSDHASHAALDIRRAGLPAPGQASPVLESRDAFSFEVVLSEGPTSARVASYVVRKTAWDAWLPGARASLRPGSVAAVASPRSRLPVPAQGASFDPNAACVDGWNGGILDDVPAGRAGHVAVWTGSLMVVWGGTARDALASAYDTGGRYDPVTDTWQQMTTVNAPQRRVEATAVWSGREMLVWGGREQNSYTAFVSGGRYDPIADRWTAMALAPSARLANSTVWTGSRMIVWAGYSDSSHGLENLSTGAMYDPSSDTWTPTATEGAPAGRFGHGAVWTGTEMIVWGGVVGRYPSGEGGRFNPSTNSWSPMASTAGRSGHSVVWTGSTMVVWGGAQVVPCPSCPGGITTDVVNTGARYDPARDVWIGMSTEGAPVPLDGRLTEWTGHFMIVLDNDGLSRGGGRYDPSTDHWTGMASDDSLLTRSGATLVWTGSQAIVWGGAGPGGQDSAFLNSGRRYDPWSDSWTPTAASGPASTRGDHSAVWTGNEMVVWGGRSLTSVFGYLDSGGRYDPASDSWTEMATASAPEPRGKHTAVWTGNEMVVWGGTGTNGNLDSGGRYDPESDTWRGISPANAPSSRSGHAAVWTGRRIVIWGGSVLPTGGVYDPTTDLWAPTSLVDAPSARSGQTAVWTGNRVVVWGGFGGVPYSVTNTGGQYDPDTDSWTPTSVIGAPSPRGGHTAVWIGDRMIVWGGESEFNLGDGGRYDPVNDSWSPISTLGEPTRRSQHVAIAAGNLMLVWGGDFDPFYGADSGGLYDTVNDRWTKFASPAPLGTGTVVWTGDAMIVWTGTVGNRFFVGHDADCDGDGVSDTAGDCDDHDATTYPGAPERCDGVANDCGSAYWPNAPAETDYDRDGWLTCAGDCNDQNPYVHPGAAEVCDGVDDDCDGQLLPQGEADNDGDGYRVCDGDCDDTNRNVHPGAFDYCNGIDDNCDGRIDEGGDAVCNNPTEPCYVGVCHGKEGCFITTPSIPCDDGDVCTVNDTCAYGHCYGTPTSGTPCDDKNECTTNDVCQAGICRGENLDGPSCDDHDVCTTGERCENGYCGGGGPTDCAQDDGNFCDGREACDPRSGCFHYAIPVCDDGNVCTDDSCDPATGCRYVPNSAPCDDGNACTAGDVCGEGLCHAGSAIACDDANVCTDDSCVPWAGCVHANNAASCDDGSACTRWDACEDGVCVGHDPVVCSAADQCLDVAACDPATGGCPAEAKPDGTPCDDGDLCTGGETCRSGICTPAYSGLSAPNPRNDGYYKGLCHSPQSGDRLTEGDAVCVATLTRTFAGITTAAAVCAELTPSHPNSDSCDRAEDDLMTLALNICRARVCTAQRIDSQCGSNDSVGRSLTEIDGILADPRRSDATCARAKCLAEEINTGRALAGH